MLAGTDAGTGVRGHVRVCGGDSAVQPHSMGGVRGGEEGHTQEHTRERTRECCTYPLATHPLKSARISGPDTPDSCKRRARSQGQGTSHPNGAPGESGSRGGGRPVSLSNGNAESWTRPRCISEWGTLHKQKQKLRPF